ncbi:MAG: ATP-binding protein [Anaerolineales bacterium]|nr:ATP-binding protein [Anaerolineales bacterium]
MPIITKALRSSENHDVIRCLAETCSNVHPCPCGYFGDSQKPCTCAPAVVTKYQKRISGPLLDRIDIHIKSAVDYEKLSGNKLGETSETIRKRVQIARNIQNQRFANSTDIVCNADMRIGEVRQFCQLQPEGQSLMRAAMSQLNLSARAYHRICLICNERKRHVPTIPYGMKSTNNT